MTILERSPGVPDSGLAVRKDLNNSIKSQLKDALLSMHNDPDGMNILKNFSAKRFIETTDDDYSEVYRYTQEIELNLANYNYKNE